MLLVISPRLAGPLAIAISGLRKWHRPADPEVRRDLARLQELLTQEATRGQRRPTFDPDEFQGESFRMEPLVVTFAEAGGMLACEVRTIRRLVAKRELATTGSGRGARVVVASLQAYVTRTAHPQQEAS